MWSLLVGRSALPDLAALAGVAAKAGVGGRDRLRAEVSADLVAAPAFKAGGTGDPRPAGSIPVHLRWRYDALTAGTYD